MNGCGVSRHDSVLYFIYKNNLPTHLMLSFLMKGKKQKFELMQNKLTYSQPNQGRI